VRNPLPLRAPICSLQCTSISTHAHTHTHTHARMHTHTAWPLAHRADAPGAQIVKHTHPHTHLDLFTRTCARTHAARPTSPTRLGRQQLKWSNTFTRSTANAGERTSNTKNSSQYGLVLCMQWMFWMKNASSGHGGIGHPQQRGSEAVLLRRPEVKRSAAYA